MSLAWKNNPNRKAWNKGLTGIYSIGEATKKKMSDAQKGRIFTDEEKRKLKEYHWSRGKKAGEIGKKLSESLKKTWKIPSIVRKRLRHRYPNKPEKILIDVINRNRLDFIYVGNGKATIDGLIPDFINSNNEKSVIEVNGDYWHNTPKLIERDRKKMEIYKKCGYKVLIIWENELTKNFDEKILVEKITNSENFL